MLCRLFSPVRAKKLTIIAATELHDAAAIAAAQALQVGWECSQRDAVWGALDRGCVISLVPPPPPLQPRRPFPRPPTALFSLPFLDLPLLFPAPPTALYVTAPVLPRPLPLQGQLDAAGASPAIQTWDAVKVWQVELQLDAMPAGADPTKEMPCMVD